jgi:hypothetical protein
VEEFCCPDLERHLYTGQAVKNQRDLVLIPTAEQEGKGVVIRYCPWCGASLYRKPVAVRS